MDDPIIIDVRTREEYAEGHLETAELLDLTNGQFQAALTDLDPGAEYLLYCRSGARSGVAAGMMKQAGFASAENLGSVQEASVATGVRVTR